VSTLLRILPKALTAGALAAGLLAPPGAGGADYRFQVSPAVPVAPASAPVGLAPVAIRFREPPTPDFLRALEAQGVRFLPGGRGEPLLHSGLFYPARVTRRGATALGRSDHVERVELDAFPLVVAPLDHSAIEVAAAPVWGQQVDGVSLTGSGIRVGMIDSGVDIFHPAFFFADGGLFDWIDVDGERTFEPGTDAVDLDRDAQVDKGEVLGMVESHVLRDLGATEILTEENGVFTPGRDWLYADANGNGRRDFGPAAGFDDASPSFGEPLFVAEDLDRDGQLDPEERLVALKTSKFVAIHQGGVERVRGRDLIHTPITADAHHGTMTAGILAAGQVGCSRWLGLAPDVEILMGVFDDADGLFAMATWLVAQRVDVMLHEYSSWLGPPLDGSTNLEALLDAASASGIPQVVPVGNLGGRWKQMLVGLAPGATVEIPVLVPAPTDSGAYFDMLLSLLWRTPGVALEFSLRDPSGRTVALSPANAGGSAWGDGLTTFTSFREDSSRGTARMAVALTAGTTAADGRLAPGTWTLSVRHPGSSGDVTLVGYLADHLSGVGIGVAWGWRFRSEKHLVGWPATADSAISVGAYVGRAGAPFDPPWGARTAGELAAYSGRGVRLDGVQIMDLTAPDNPIAPTASTGAPFRGNYGLSIGTSAAGPHVAAAVALLKQHAPTLDSAAIARAIQQGARTDAFVDAGTFEEWGYGKLRVFRSLFGRDPTPSTPPSAAIAVPAPVHAGNAAGLVPVVSDLEDPVEALQIRWDVDYDGVYDTPYGPVTPLDRTFSAPVRTKVKLQVKDSQGLNGAAAVAVEVLPGIALPPALFLPQLYRQAFRPWTAWPGEGAIVRTASSP
jgi:hypothetical protein